MTSTQVKFAFGAVAVIGIVAALWFLVVSPRLELADAKVDKAETNQKRQKRVTDALDVLRQAEADVAAEKVAAQDAVAAEAAPIIQRETIIRERIVERAAKDGDPYVSDGMGAFLQDLAE